VSLPHRKDDVATSSVGTIRFLAQEVKRLPDMLSMIPFIDAFGFPVAREAAILRCSGKPETSGYHRCYILGLLVLQWATGAAQPTGASMEPTGASRCLLVLPSPQAAQWYAHSS
jgi:hypothetical protein